MKFREFNLRRDSQCPVSAFTHDYRTDRLRAILRRPDQSSVVSCVTQEKLDAREPVQLVDVREPFEHEIASIDSAQLIPLGELPDRLKELAATPDDSALSQRNAQRAGGALVREAGFSNVFNLEGGSPNGRRDRLGRAKY